MFRFERTTALAASGIHCIVSFRSSKIKDHPLLLEHHNEIYPLRLALTTTSIATS